jgi:PAS domain S-box-containing protein
MQLPQLLEPMRFLFFWASVLLSAIIGGTGAGLFAVALSVLAAAFLEFPWIDIAEGRDRADAVRIGIYAAFASAISVAVGLRDVANRRVDVLREFLGTTLHSIGDAVIVTDSKGAIIFLNPVAAALTDWPLEQAIGKRVDEVFVVRKEETLAPIDHPVMRALQRRETILMEDHVVLLTRAGTTLAVDDSAAPIRGSDGRLSGAVLVFRDVTRQREAERTLIQADNAKDQFLATLSHDLRTPLTAILGWTRMLKAGGLDEATSTEGLDTIEQNATAQADLIEDILDVTRIASGKIALNRVRIDVVSLLQEAAQSLRPSLSAKDIGLDMRLEPGEVNVFADRKRLRQIVWNLISNAIKFSSPNGKIELELKHADGIVELNVIDHGIGIDAADLPRVFERFGQAHGEESVKLGGLGLGLAIVKDLAELHGGSVTAFSGGRGSGATFTVRLPAAV